MKHAFTFASLFAIAAAGGCGADDDPGAGNARAESAAGSGSSSRAQAAAVTANTDPACVDIQPFYWEIGDRNSVLAGGTASATGGTVPDADTTMLIASASKWF